MATMTTPIWNMVGIEVRGEDYFSSYYRPGFTMMLTK